MDPTKLLEADHRMVESLFEEIEQAEGEARTPLIEELATNLRAHMELEETTVYPQIEPVVGAETIQEGIKEHELARKALEDMLALAPDQPGFGGAMEAVKAGVQHHVEEEETQVFPTVRKEGQDTLATLSTPVMQKRMELGMPMDASALEAASTKEELLQEAKSAEVSGAASMTKTQLAEALVDKMSSM